MSNLVLGWKLGTCWIGGLGGDDGSRMNPLQQ
jgi:hypothetical protein